MLILPEAVHPFPMFFYILFALAGVAKLFDISLRRVAAIADAEGDLDSDLSERYDSSGNTK